MKKIKLLLIAALSAAGIASFASVDPNHTATGGYGHLIDKGKKLEIPESLYTDEKTYDKNPADALAFRKQVAEAIEAALNQNR